MQNLQTLKTITTKPELAKLLDIKPAVFTHSLYVTKPANQYSQFKIPKKNGGERTINAPTGKLKTIQSALSNLGSSAESVEIIRFRQLAKCMI